MNVFAKIFAQIFDSSIASDYVVRHVFMDLLVLADRDGVVDMTLDAISRRTNVPEQIIAHAIQELMKPDRRSRSHEEQGRRIIPLDSHRDWGWQIVNFEHYRAIRDEESRKTYFRDYKRKYRQSKQSTSSPQCPHDVLDSPTMSTEGEGELEGEEEREGEKKTAAHVLDKAPLRSLDDHERLPVAHAAYQVSAQMDHVDIGRAVAERCRITSWRVREAIEAQAKLELADGRTVEDVEAEMSGAWEAYQRAGPTFGAEKFFGEGMWRDSKTWRQKGNGNGNRDPKGYAAALRELDLEEERDQARANQHGNFPPGHS